MGLAFAAKHSSLSKNQEQQNNICRFVVFALEESLYSNKSVYFHGNMSYVTVHALQRASVHFPIWIHALFSKTHNGLSNLT